MSSAADKAKAMQVLRDEVVRDASRQATERALQAKAASARHPPPSPPHPPLTQPGSSNSTPGSGVPFPSLLERNDCERPFLAHLERKNVTRTEHRKYYVDRALSHRSNPRMPASNPGARPSGAALSLDSLDRLHPRVTIHLLGQLG